MAYDGRNLSCVLDSIAGGTIRLYVYDLPPGDTLADTATPGYFSDGGKRGAKVGDIIWVAGIIGITSELEVTAVSTTGVLTVAIGGGLDFPVATTKPMMAAISPNKQIAFLKIAGQFGFWLSDTSDLSAEVAADPDQSHYIAFASDITGAGGAWVKAFGTVGDQLWSAETQVDARAILGIPEVYPLEKGGTGSVLTSQANFRILASVPGQGVGWVTLGSNLAAAGATLNASIGGAAGSAESHLSTAGYHTFIAQDGNGLTLFSDVPDLASSFDLDPSTTGTTTSRRILSGSEKMGTHIVSSREAWGCRIQSDGISWYERPLGSSVPVRWMHRFGGRFCFAPQYTKIRMCLAFLQSHMNGNSSYIASANDVYHNAPVNNSNRFGMFYGEEGLTSRLLGNQTSSETTTMADATYFAGIIPLREGVSHVQGETFAWSFCSSMESDLDDDEGLLICNVAISASNLSQASPGSAQWYNAMRAIEEAALFCRENGRDLTVDFVFMQGGNADVPGTTTATYLAALRTHYDTFQTQMKQITGQADDASYVITQLASANGDNIQVPLAQLAFCNDYPTRKVFPTAPEYRELPSTTEGGTLDSGHPGYISQMFYGIERARVCKLIRAGTMGKPLQVIDATRSQSTGALTIYHNITEPRFVAPFGFCVDLLTNPGITAPMGYCYRRGVDGGPYNDAAFTIADTLTVDGSGNVVGTVTGTPSSDPEWIYCGYKDTGEVIGPNMARALFSDSQRISTGSLGGGAARTMTEHVWLSRVQVRLIS